MTDIARERGFLAAQGLDILTRETWGAAQSYTSARTVFEPVEGFVLHISVTIDHGDLTGNEHADMRTIERIGQERFGIGFPYNAAVFDTGRLYEGQPLTRRGAHTVDDKNIGYRSTGSSRSMNYWWRAIVLPQMVTDDVTDAQVHQCARWAAAQIRAGYAKRNTIWIGHRDVAWKSCPGDAGYARLPEIRAWTEHYVVNGLGTLPQPLPLEDDDMPVIYECSADRNRPFLLSDGSGLSPLVSANTVLKMIDPNRKGQVQAYDLSTVEEYDLKVAAASIADEVADMTQLAAAMHAELMALRVLSVEQLEELHRLTAEEPVPVPPS